MSHKYSNIILIVLDTARADRFSCYGYGRHTTPHLDAFARRATLFENAFVAAPWRLPSHGSLFTGLYPSTHGLNRIGTRLDAGIPTLAELLRGAGYHTVGISNNSLVGRMSGLDRGFEVFQEPREPFAGVPSARLKGYLRTIYRHLHGQKFDLGAAKTNRLASKYLHHSDGRPLFLFINYMDTHQPCDAPAAYRFAFTAGRRREADRVNQDVISYLAGAVKMEPRDFSLLSDLYDGQLLYVDSKVGEILSLLEGHGLLDRSLVIVTSDHGENLGEHGLMGHVFSVHDTLLRIPLLISYPDLFPAGLRVEQPVSLLDLVPTVASLVGLALDGWPGQPIIPGNLTPRSHLVAEYLDPHLEVLKRRFPACDCQHFDRQMRVIRQANLKFVWSSRGDHEFYDLATDPGEEKNLYPTQHAMAAELESALARWTQQVVAGSAAGAVEVAGELAERLAGLGYI